MDVIPLHPIVRAALAPAMPPAVRIEQYVAALKAFDWYFESSGSIDHFERMRDELQRLRAEQMVVDPGGALWKEHGDPGLLLGYGEPA